MATILVIEDEPAIRDNIVETLELDGHDALGAADGQQGVDLAQQITPDLVLCDVMMAGLDGYGVLRTLRADAVTRRLPFVFVSALGDAASVDRGMRMGADGYLVKPFSSDDLLGIVRERLLAPVAADGPPPDPYRAGSSTQPVPLSVRRKDETVPTRGNPYRLLRARVLALAAEQLGESLDGMNSVREAVSRRLKATDGELALTEDPLSSTPPLIGHLVAQTVALARLDGGLVPGQARPGTELTLRDLWLNALDDARSFVLPRPDVDIHLEDHTGGQELDCLRVNGDTALIQHALAELLANALAHSPQYGSLTLSLWCNQGSAWFSVADDGEGMEPITIAAAMGEAEAVHGGLGLTVARRIAQCFGGGLAIQSNPATGTVAALWLPSQG